MLPLEFGFVGSPLLKKEAINNYKRSLVDTPENQNLTIRLQISLPFSLRDFFIIIFAIFTSFLLSSQSLKHDKLLFQSLHLVQVTTPREHEDDDMFSPLAISIFLEHYSPTEITSFLSSNSFELLKELLYLFLSGIGKL